MRKLAALFLVVFSLIATSAAARDPVRVELLNGGYGGEADTALMGLKVALDEGWHTYWKSAGEGGFPPAIDTSRSSNLASFDLRWPAPQRIETGAEFGGPPLQTNGYTKGVIIPVLVKPSDIAKDVDVRLDLRVFACKDICAAFDFNLSAAINPGFASGTTQREIASWLRKVPRAEKSGLHLTPPADLGNGRFEITLTSQDPRVSSWLHVADASNTPYTVEVVDVGVTARRPWTRFLVTPQGGSFDSGGVEIVGTSGGSAVSAKFSTPDGPAPIGLDILLTAFIGGLILNLMPCVFPVLSLKLMSLTNGDVRKARLGFAGSSLGIIVSFLAIASALAAMKALGMEIGWGIQFQSPVFLACMAVVVLLFAANTAGLFEITIPGKTSTWLTRRTDGQSFAASVGQGFVATLLATPCSAPFVGTAVGFALAGTALDILAVFLAMGLGMALPFIAIASIPGLARVMPRPGKWMNNVKLAMSIALFATAGWLLSTLFQIEANAAYLVICAAAVTTFSIAVKGKNARSLALAIVAAAVFALPCSLDRFSARDDAGISWRPFERDRIGSLVAEGEIVVVNMTAKWCLTCKLNERTTWNVPEVKAALGGTVAMQGDWTKPDHGILGFLRENGRFGIPFTVVYSPQAPRGDILPEILSPKVVIEALKARKIAVEVSN
jgi:suppressor for copper-sensitivity B|nr:protein-disulfide reductase DsbD domain-containing protein [Neorhizobium tomejilense]